MKLKKIIYDFELNLITVLLPVMCTIVLFATFGRYTKWYSTPWAEELSRYIFIWIVFPGTVIGVKRQAHYNVDVLVEKLPPGGKTIVYYIQVCVELAFFGFIAYQAAKIMRVQIRMSQTSPSLKIPMYLAYGAIPTGMVLSFIWTAVAAVRKMISKGGREERTNAD